MVAISRVKKPIMLLLCLLLIGYSLGCRATHKPSDLVSCYKLGGKCRLPYACPNKRQADVKTICLSRRKLCCLKSPVI